MAVAEMERHELIEQLDSAKLYGILDLGYTKKVDLESVAEALLLGGVGVLQLRAKGYDGDDVIKLIDECAPRLNALCRDHGVPLIVNDFPEVALAVEADGVHIGQDDGSLVDVRKVIGDQMLVGRSTHSVAQAQAALEEGFDYIGYGPLFPTPTKQGRPGIGLENIKVVMDSVGKNIPVFCIGGIKPKNLELVLASGAHRVVIVSALLQATDITNVTRSVVDVLNLTTE